MTSVFDKREKMSGKLLKQGHATMKELLEASFGEWPLKGLDIDQDIPHDQKVEFKSIFSASGSKVWNLLALAGSVLGFSNDRVICINGCMRKMEKLILCGFTSTIGHEAVHILQGDHLYRAESIFGKENARKIWTSQRKTTSDEIMDGLVEYNKKFVKGKLKKKFKAVEKKGSNLSYLIHGDEMQARIHEVMAEGYQRWKKMPQNNEELWMAMSSARIKLPEEILDRLRVLPKTSGAYDFIKKSVFKESGAGGIQTVLNTLSTEATTLFWNHALPKLYADLIEMYGDKKGRERFCPGEKNIKTKSFYLPTTGKCI